MHPAKIEQAIKAILQMSSCRLGGRAGMRRYEVYDI